MAYQMAQLPMTLSDAEGHFCCFKSSNTHNSRNIACLTIGCLHMNWKSYAVCDLNNVKGKGLLKVTGSHVHWKSGDISETVLDKDVTTSH